MADDHQLSSWSVDDPWAVTFVNEMRNVVTPLAGQLTPLNYDRVVLLSAQVSHFPQDHFQYHRKNVVLTPFALRLSVETCSM